MDYRGADEYSGRIDSHVDISLSRVTRCKDDNGEHGYRVYRQAAISRPLQKYEQQQ
jgi:hypothetical protein